MRCNNQKGQMAATEAVIIIILIAALGLVGWLLISKKSESTTYAADSKPKVTSLEVKPTFGGCVDLKVEEFMEGKRDAVINSQVSH